MAGSSEGHRQNLYENLKKKYNVKRIGGLIEGDIYLSHEEYAKEISQSMIVINTDTVSSRIQLKGRVNQCFAAGVLSLTEKI